MCTPQHIKPQVFVCDQYFMDLTKEHHHHVRCGTTRVLLLNQGQRFAASVLVMVGLLTASQVCSLAHATMTSSGRATAARVLFATITAERSPPGPASDLVNVVNSLRVQNLVKGQQMLARSQISALFQHPAPLLKGRVQRLQGNFFPVLEQGTVRDHPWWG